MAPHSIRELAIEAAERHVPPSMVEAVADAVAVAVLMESKATLTQEATAIRGYQESFRDKDTGPSHRAHWGGVARGIQTAIEQADLMLAQFDADAQTPEQEPE